MGVLGIAHAGAEDAKVSLTECCIRTRPAA